MTTDYEFLVPTSCICIYKNIRVWRLSAPSGRGPACLAHSAHPIAAPLVLDQYGAEHFEQQQFGTAGVD